MQTKFISVKYSCKIPITDSLRVQVIERLKTIQPTTLLGIAYQNFSKNAHSKSDRDFQELLGDMFCEIQQNPDTVKKILGLNFNFFKKLLS